MTREGQKKDEKLKPLNPTLRQKKRFLKVKINSKKKYSFNDLAKPLTKAIVHYIGQIDFSKEGVWLIKERYDEENQIVIIKVSTKLKEKLCGALVLIDKLDQEAVELEIIKVGATFKTLE